MSVSFHPAPVGVTERHAAAGRNSDGGRASNALAVPTFSLMNGQITSDLLLCGVLAGFLELKFVIVESGIGRFSFGLETCDYTFEQEQVWKEHPEFADLLPSDLLRRQVYVNYWFEELQQSHLDGVGADNILFETEFPHNVSIWDQEEADAVKRLDWFPEMYARRSFGVTQPNYTAYPQSGDYPDRHGLVISVDLDRFNTDLAAGMPTGRVGPFDERADLGARRAVNISRAVTNVDAGVSSVAR
jgi:hypothetical protein